MQVLDYKVRMFRDYPRKVLVEAKDGEEHYIASFKGPNAMARANEYADFMNKRELCES